MEKDGVMMKNKLTRSVLLFSALLLAGQTLASCGDSAVAQSAENTAPVTEAVVTETETEPIPTSNVPADVTFETGTEVNVLNSGRYDSERVMLNPTAQTGDVLNDAIFQRNQDIQEKLNIKINYIDYDYDCSSLMQKTVMAGDTSYDVFSGLGVYLLASVTKNLFYDLLDAPYIDVQNPWWATDFIENLSINGNHRYYLSGDITTLFLRWLPCVYFNKNLYASYYDDGNALYQTVLDGKWTLDLYNDLTKDLWQDLNQNNKTDEGDMLGCGVIDCSITDSIFLSSGGTYTTVNPDGSLTINPVTERNISIVEKMNRLYYENPSTCMYASSWDVINQDITAKFASDQMMFMNGWFYSSDYLRDMKSDYGIIPMPKADESVDKYRSIIYIDTDVFAVPTTCTKIDAVCAYMEDMAFIGYQTVSPTYYDTVLKGKYMRDSSSEAATMLDLIHDGSFTDPAYAYSNLISVGVFHREILKAKSNDVASKYEKKKKTYDKEIEKLFAAFEESEG